MTKGSNEDNQERDDLLFSGLSFWVSAKVPQRSRFVDQIKKNGGKVVAIEGHADFRLVDDMKNDIYSTIVTSYKFVEECLRQKTFLNPEEFKVSGTSKLCGKAKRKGSGNDAQSSKTDKETHAIGRKYKSGRTPFTHEDDKILLNTISKKGVAYNGNNIYKILEAQYPHHTWQSWRSRWYDQLSKTRPNGPVPLDDSEESEAEVEKEPSHFSSNDDDLLLSMKHEIITSQNQKSIYRKINQKYPHHSVAEWRDRFINVLLPRLNKKEVMKTPVEEGLDDDVSPRGSEEELEDEHEELLETGFENAAKLDEKVHKTSEFSYPSTPSPKRPPIKQHFRKSYSLPDRLVRPQATRAQVRRFSDVAQVGFSTPAHHPTSTGILPSSPKEHQTLPISPAHFDRKLSERSNEVQKWRVTVPKQSASKAEAGGNAKFSPTKPSLKRSRSPDESPEASLARFHKRQRHSKNIDESWELSSNPEQSILSQKQSSPTASNRGATFQTPLSTSNILQYIVIEDDEEDQEGLSDSLQLRYGSSLSRKETSDGSHAEDVAKSEKEDGYTDDELASNRTASKEPKGKEKQLLLNSSQQTRSTSSPDAQDQHASEESDELASNKTASKEPKGKEKVYLNSSQQTRSTSSPDVQDHHASEEPDEFQRVTAYVKSKAKEYKLSEEVVSHVIMRVNAIDRLVCIVLQELSEGRGLPDRRGVWTPKDDEYLTSGDERLRRLMEIKHGDVQERLDFLDLWNSVPY